LADTPDYLTANNLIGGLPAKTAYFIGVALITMMTGQLVHHQGSLARAVLPYICICAGDGTVPIVRWRAVTSRSIRLIW